MAKETLNNHTADVDQGPIIQAHVILKETLNSILNSDPWILALNILLGLLVLLFSITEITQVVSFGWDWLKDPKNWLQTINISISWYLVASLFLPETLTPCILNRHLISILLPLTYYEGLYELGYHPVGAKYINMFNRVLTTFIKYFIVYLGMVVCFAFGFFFMLLFHLSWNQGYFEDASLRLSYSYR